MNILERIEKIAVSEGITVTALERIIGASKGVLSRAIAKKTDIQTKWIQLLVENYPQYSTDWLLTGQGDMLRSEGDSIVSEPQSIQQSEVITLLKEQLKEKEVELKELYQEIGMLKNDNRKLMEQVMGLGLSECKSSISPSQSQDKDAPSVTAHL